MDWTTSPHARKPGVRKVDLRTMAIVRELQENSELGEFRIHAALKQLGIDLSPRACGRILALNRWLYGLRGPARAAREPKLMPFRASRRHQYWTVDIRYLDHHLDDERIYCISILENYSRAILASGISRRQDLTAYLMVLFAAIRQHGARKRSSATAAGCSVPNKRSTSTTARHPETNDRAAAIMAVLHRNGLQRTAAHGRLALRAGHHVGGSAHAARSVGGRLQLPGPLGASGARG